MAHMAFFLGAKYLFSGIQNPSLFSSLEIKYLENLKSSTGLPQFFSTSLIFQNSLIVPKVETTETVIHKQAFIFFSHVLGNNHRFQLLVDIKGSPAIQVNPGGCTSCIEGSNVTLLIGECNKKHSKVDMLFVFHHPCVVSFSTSHISSAFTLTPSQACHTPTYWYLVGLFSKN